VRQVVVATVPGHYVSRARENEALHVVEEGIVKVGAWRTYNLIGMNPTGARSTCVPIGCSSRKTMRLARTEAMSLVSSLDTPASEW
jgi:hypothetical protein